jgi:hypothetical protein
MPPKKIHSFEELGASLGRDRAKTTPIERNPDLDTEAATRAKVEKSPYSVRKVGREALRLWVKPLADYLAKSTPPRGFEQVLLGLDHEQLAFLALRSMLDQIHFGWVERKDRRKDKRKRRPKNPKMKFRLELGRSVRDELEFAGLLGAEKYAKAARKKYDVLGWLKFRRLDWTECECALIGDWLWNALAQMTCFDTDKRGYPCLHADHKAAMDKFAEEVLFDHPLYKPKLTAPPPWTAWRVECPGDIGATFVEANDPETIERVKAAFADGSIEPHARAVSAIQSVPLKINARLLPLVREFAGDEYRRDVVVAEAFVNRPRFWNRVRCDFRGRLIQMSDFNYTRGDPVRSLFMFADGKEIGTAIGWLDIAIANAFGRKGTWPERHAWVAANHEMVKAVAADPSLIWRGGIVDREGKAPQEPFQFAAACLEFVAADTHCPTYETHLPVWLDATSNGLQHIAIAMRDIELAEIVNLKVRASEREPKIHDVYDIVARHMQPDLSADELSQSWLEHKDKLRDLLKKPIMTLPYGVTPQGMLDQIKEKCDEFGVKASREARMRLRDRIWKAIEEKLPAAMEMRKYVQAIAQYCLCRGTYMQWVTLSGFPGSNRYCESETHRVRLPFLGQSVTIADGYTDTPIKRDVKNGAVANFVHSLDAALLALSMNEAVRQRITNVMVVHDCFGALAPDVQRFARIRRLQLVNMARYNPLAVLHATNLPPPTFDPEFDICCLAGSEYFDR